MNKNNNMKNKKVKIGETYHLDLSGSSPVEVKVLGKNDKTVKCTYLSSWQGRVEELDWKFFEMNGFIK